MKRRMPRRRCFVAMAPMALASPLGNTTTKGTVGEVVVAPLVAVDIVLDDGAGTAFDDVAVGSTLDAAFDDGAAVAASTISVFTS